MNYPVVVPMIIHRHNAFRAGLHFDWRIKYPDKRMLASFVIPKDKFPNLPGTKCIAIQAPDHSMQWLKKDKIRIPAGEYGGGYIETIQKGELTVLTWKDDYIVVEVEGEFANGRYYFINTKRKQGSKRQNKIWILLKEKDD
jgi:hypothetical protein